LRGVKDVALGKDFTEVPVDQEGEGSKRTPQRLKERRDVVFLRVGGDTLRSEVVPLSLLYDQLGRTALFLMGEGQKIAHKGERSERRKSHRQR